ncbi:hypothetical protein PHLCEN_2v3115 [Hermanssonia centrifuga]|uniref:ATP-dependent DNA helicase n=1 Tax=Hermanssonia centrifuga TaxID=98765 RepID=A0A2R6R3Y3_9APHY|nr:hypothetical protein PHLCEN_2v3115 [Hermanssonia centrifuga]
MAQVTSADISPEALEVFTIAEIRSMIGPHLVVPRSSSQPKPRLVDWIVTHADPPLRRIIRTAWVARLAENEHKSASKKRKQSAQKQTQRKAARIEAVLNHSAHDISKYMELPSEAILQECSQQFIAATSDAAVMLSICAVCAREVGVEDDTVASIALPDIPNQAQLIPLHPHAAHDLYNGMLLEPKGIHTSPDERGVQHAAICGSCQDQLTKANTPLLSLANGLWIGRVPWELTILTVPEQLLVAQLYPRIYVFKLYPKDPHIRPDQGTLQSAMRGNVSTYDQDLPGIASMVEGRMLPRPLEILSSVITVTFIGKGQPQKQWFRSLFRVRRDVVHNALKCLKQINPYYGNVDINLERLNALPEDDIPDEIAELMRHTSDTGLVDSDAPGYVPEHPDIDPHIPDVIPLQVSGSIDTDLTKLTSNELMLWGISNLWEEGREGGYSIRRGSRPVPDLPPRRPAPAETNRSANTTQNFFERAFPCLFPYGCGGLDTPRTKHIDFGAHIQWCLQYHDKRFRKHETFPFLCFGILQKRDALNQAHVQMLRADFERDAHVMSTLTVGKLQAAQREEDLGLHSTDPAVRVVRKHLHATAGRVLGTDQSRYRMRGEIRSTSIEQGPPAVWLTVNPGDSDDPIAQALLGEQISLDDFVATSGPNKQQRMKNIASDPYGAAKFFHFTIKALLKTLLQITVSNHQVHSKPGIFGEVSAYYGTVESQGRGTLHLHMLVWLKNTPSGDELEDLFKSEEFRTKMRTFINANVRAYLPGLESAASVKAIRPDSEVAYSRPLDPSSPSYAEDVAAFELRLVRSLQVHTCKVRRCLQPNKVGKMLCKRKAPWQIAAEAFVTEAGHWGPKRLYGFVNGYCPAIILNLRCNNDCKILTNGAETKNITFYVTGYAAKKQGRNFNTSAILAEGYASHLKRPNPEYVDRIRHNQRLMLFRLIHAINHEQELASCMVMSYLMGWGDVYRSHQYSSVYWSSFVSALLKAYPEVQAAPSNHTVATPLVMNDGAEGPVPTSAREDNSHNSEDSLSENVSGEVHDEAIDNRIDEMITLDFNGGGRLYARSQVTDYVLRGDELEHYSVYEMFLNTYEATRIKGKDRADRDDAANDPGDQEHPSEHADVPRRRGRPAHQRSPYRLGHPKAAEKERVVRTPLHKNLVNFVGRFFPSRNDATIYPFYCASMLLLFKPWRNIATDLKSANETWADAFSCFVTEHGGSGSLPRRLSGIQTFHDGRVAALNDPREDAAAPLDDVELQGVMRGIDDPNEDSEDLPHGVVVTPEIVQALLQSQVVPRERNHARQAIELAKNARIFQEQPGHWSPTHLDVSSAVGDDVSKLAGWQAQMDRDVLAQNSGPSATAQPVPPSSTQEPSVQPFAEVPGPSVSSRARVEVSSPLAQPGIFHAADPSILKDDQFRAFDIVRWHLEQVLSDKTPPPLRMVLYGEGGTGKSKVIQTITEEFNRRCIKGMLVKAAYTGVAASLIDGKTTHNIGGLSVKERKESVSDDTKAKLQSFWKEKRYLIIDEVSMISKSFLIDMERNISIGMQGADGFQSDYSFGGLNVIICGDFHQFPPVAKGPDEFLFQPADLSRHSEGCVLGRRVYEEFTTVVILKEQMRVTDHVWRDLLVHLRKGEVQEHHIDCLRTLVLSTPGAEVDFGSAPWQDASLVTPRHAVRNLWNEHAARKWCAKSENQLFICYAEDRIRKGSQRVSEELSLGEQYAVAMRGQSVNRRRRQDLPRTVELAKGMKVLVTTNLETDLDLTNGARGEIVDIILDPEEPPVGDGSIVHLHRLPLYVLVRMSRTRASQLAGLDEGVIPVQPMASTMRIKLNINPKTGKGIQRTVHRRQYPITPAYAFTDYRAQGQTLPYVLVDIASPPTGGLNLFNVYVALSRSSGRETIRLLRDFDDEVFTQAHDAELTLEDERLEELDVVTKRWWQVVNGEQRLAECRAQATLDAQSSAEQSSP